MASLRLLALCALLACAGSAAAARIEIPLRVSVETLREALAAQLASSSYREGPCRYLKLEAPQVLLHSCKGRLKL